MRSHLLTHCHKSQELLWISTLKTIHEVSIQQLQWICYSWKYTHCAMDNIINETSLCKWKPCILRWYPAKRALPAGYPQLHWNLINSSSPVTAAIEPEESQYILKHWSLNKHQSIIDWYSPFSHHFGNGFPWVVVVDAPCFGSCL